MLPGLFSSPVFSSEPFLHTEIGPSKHPLHSALHLLLHGDRGSLSHDHLLRAPTALPAILLGLLGAGAALRHFRFPVGEHLPDGSEDPVGGHDRGGDLPVDPDFAVAGRAGVREGAGAGGAVGDGGDRGGERGAGRAEDKGRAEVNVKN